MYSFLIDVGTTQMTTLTTYAKDTISDLSPIFLLVIGVAIALLVFGALISMSRK